LDRRATPVEGPDLRHFWGMSVDVTLKDRA
jgi:hypothetical protein